MELFSTEFRSGRKGKLGYWKVTKLMRTISISALLLFPLVSACAATQSEASDQLDEARNALDQIQTQRETRTSFCDGADRDTIRYIGKTENDLQDCIFSFPEATVLKITSGGGNVSKALSVARIVADRDLTVEVIGLCGSSCGNYILPAADRILIHPYSGIFLHGAPSDDPGTVRNAIINSLESGTHPELADDVELVDEQVRKLLGVRENHDAFVATEAVGKGWYHLDFYYEYMERNRLTSGMLFTSAQFTAQCLGETTDIVSFWQPDTPEEQQAFRELFDSPLLLMGIDVPPPESCS